MTALRSSTTDIPNTANQDRDVLAILVDQGHVQHLHRRTEGEFALRANHFFFFVFSHRTAAKAPGHRWTLRHTPSPPPPLVLLNLPRELIDAIAASLRALRGRVKVAGAAGLFEAGRCLEARRKQESCPRGPESNVLCMLAYQVQSRGAEGQVVVRVREAI